MSDFDLYEDILTAKDQSKDDQITPEEIEKLQKEVEDTRKKFKRLMEINCDLKANVIKLESNLSTLMKTCRAEINRKNDTIAVLRRELDGISAKLTLRQGGSSSEEVRDLTSRLKKILDEDKPAKLSIAEGAKKIKPKNGSINVTHFSLDDVYTIKIGNTSFTSIVCGDVKKDEKKDVLTIEQRCDILKEIGPSNELPKKLEETVDQPTVNQNSANRTESKGSDQRNSGPEKKSDTETKTTSSNSKKEDYKKNRHKSPEKSKNIDKRSDRSSHHKKSSTDSARSEKPHRDHHRHSSHKKESSDRKSSDKENSKRSERSSSRSRRRSSSPTNKHVQTRPEKSTSYKGERSASSTSSNQQSSTKPKTRISNPSSTCRTKNSSNISREKPKEGENAKPTERAKTVAPPSPGDMGTSELESLLEEKQRLLLNLSNEETNLLQLQKSGEDAQMGTGDLQQIPKNDTEGKMTILKDKGKEQAIAEVEDSNSSINGLLSTPNFLEAQLDWSAESFPHFKTPNKKSRERTESETSSNTDFNTVGGIAAILGGRLVPSSSYVSPKSGMIRTPEATPGKDKLVKPEDKANGVCIAGTRHRSKKVAQELQGSGNDDETKTSKEQVNEDLEGLGLGTSVDLVQSLGLDISSSSADESSPIKKQQKNRKQKKTQKAAFRF